MRVREIVREAPKMGAVPSKWTTLTKNWNTKALLALGQAVSDEGVDPQDDAAVLGLWHKLTADAQARYRTLRQEASKDHQEYEARASARAGEMNQLARAFPHVRSGRT